MSRDYPLVLVIDLETAHPKLAAPSGSLDKNGMYVEDRYQHYCSRIWQIAATCEFGDFDAYVHPGILAEELSDSSKKFVSKVCPQFFEKVPRNRTLPIVWDCFCKWLVNNMGSRREIILVAQQIRHGDEIVLAVEMARHGLKWPDGFKMYAVEPLYSIRKCLVQHYGECERSWTVSALYEELSGFSRENAHDALQDAKCLLSNLKTCWALKMTHNLGLLCPKKHLKELTLSVDNMEMTFWSTVPQILGWEMKPPKDHRQSIWSLTTRTRKDMGRWDPAIVSALEDLEGIYTISDLVERWYYPNFISEIITIPILRDNIQMLQWEVNQRTFSPHLKAPTRKATIRDTCLKTGDEMYTQIPPPVNAYEFPI